MTEEFLIQCAVVKHIKYQFPDIVFTCSPGNASSPFKGKLNKMLGYLKGWPDLFIAFPKNGYNGLFVELKTEKGKLDKINQKPLIDKLNSLGYKAVVCYGLDEALAQIDNYLLSKNK